MGCTEDLLWSTKAAVLTCCCAGALALGQRCCKLAARCVYTAVHVRRTAHQLPWPCTSLVLLAQAHSKGVPEGGRRFGQGRPMGREGWGRGTPNPLSLRWAAPIHSAPACVDLGLLLAAAVPSSLIGPRAA